MRAVEINGYGNILHFGSLAVLVAPLVAGWIYSRFGSKLAILGLVTLVYSLLLVYTRAGIVFVSLGLSLIILFGLLRKKVFGTTLAVLAFILWAHSSAEAVKYHMQGLSTLAHHIAPSLGIFGKPEQSDAKPTGAEAVTAPQNSESSPPSSEGPRLTLGRVSADVRADAWKLGLEIARANWLTGIGYAAYQLAEPIFTSPHSLFLKRWAEGGILGAISILLLAAYPFLRLCRLALSTDSDFLQLGCVVGLCCFFLQAMIFGGDLSMMGLIVWGYGAGMMIVEIADRQPGP